MRFVESRNYYVESMFVYIHKPRAINSNNKYYRKFYETNCNFTQTKLTTKLNEFLSECKTYWTDLLVLYCVL